MPTPRKKDGDTIATRKNAHYIRVTRGCARVFFLGEKKRYTQSQKLNKRENSKETPAPIWRGAHTRAGLLGVSGDGKGDRCSLQGVRVPFLLLYPGHKWPSSQ